MSTPNLVSFFPVVVLMCVFGSTSGLTRKRADGRLADGGGDAIDVLDLRLALQIECGNADVDRVDDLLIGFSDAGVDDLFRIATRLHGAEQFAAAGHIKSATFVGKHLAKIDIAAALDAVADGRLQRRKRVGDLAVVPEQRGLGVNISRRPHLRRDAAGGDVFTIKFAVAVVEKVHRKQ